MKVMRNTKHKRVETKSRIGISVFVYSKELDAYSGVVLFPKKVAMAKKIIAESGIPPRHPVTEKRKR